MFSHRCIFLTLKDYLILDVLIEVAENSVENGELREEEIIDSNIFDDILDRVYYLYRKRGQRVSKDNKINHEERLCHACKNGVCLYLKKI